MKPFPRPLDLEQQEIKELTSGKQVKRGDFFMVLLNCFSYQLFCASELHVFGVVVLMQKNDDD